MSSNSRFPARRRARALSCALSANLLLAASAWAQVATAPENPASDIVVTATRLPTPASEVASSVTVITSDDIAAQNAQTLPDVLADVPGVSMVQTGGPGGITNLYIRGTNDNETKIFIDGIDVSDPSSVQGSFDFAHVLLSDVDRIEILRGPQSGLYGGDAIGGVVNIITKSGSGPLKLTASIDGGSFDTLNQTVGASGSQGRLSYVIDFAHFNTGATPVTPANIVPAGQPYNNDSYDNETGTAKLGFKVTDTFDLGFVARFVDYTLDTQNTPPEPLPDVSSTRQLFTRTTAHFVNFDGVLDQTFGVGYTDYHNRYLDPNYFEAFPPNPYLFSGDRLKFDWQGNITVAKGEIVTLGAEDELDRTNAQNVPPPNLAAENRTDSGYAQLQSSVAGQFFNTASVRYDSNSQFGGKATFREAPAYLIAATGTKLKASVGTGFNPPSLVELYENFPAYDFFGNPNLRPETSIGYDAGFEQAVLDQRVTFGSTYFRNDIKNLIDVNALGTSYANIGKAHSYGFENFVAWRPIEAVTLRVDYTYTLALNDVIGEELLRVPKNKVTFQGTWQVTEAASLNSSVLYVGSDYDVNRADTATYLPENGYYQVNVAGSYDLGHGVTAFTRIDNLLDRHYQYPLGFMRPGLGVFAGVRVALDTGLGGT